MTRVFSGIQPTGQKHIGNYLGAIRHYVADQERYGSEAIFCVVDLHSMTQPFEPAELTASTRDTFATLVASGLDPERAIVFVQSHVHEHAELAWLFNCIATTGELSRMVAFKEKAAGRESVSCGLFTYPVLQAADILLYLADRVPVGEDQRQHLELARDIAQRFNSRYGELFPPPQASIPPTAARISDLQEPSRKMSTSSLSSEDGRLLMLDEPVAIRRKFKRAVTDSGSEIRHDWETKPGVSNLLEILQGVTGEPIPALEARYEGKGYGHLKLDTAEAVIEHFAPIRERHAALMADTVELDRLMALGASRARAIAVPVLAEAKARMGLLPGAPAKRALAEVDADRSISQPTARLTPRQQEVMRFVADGWTNREIAAKLHLREETVKWHVRAVMSALQSKSRRDAAEMFEQLGMLEQHRESTVSSLDDAD